MSETNLAELDKLVQLFHDDVKQLGAVQSVSASQIPEPQRSLLDHNLHMTVTLEKFHSSLVDVHVMQQHESDDDVYNREIRLHRQSDGNLVQYGIVRLNFKHLDAEVQTEIRNQSAPLGRILIEHDVHRRVQLLCLYEIAPSEECVAKLGLGSGSNLYGRTAIIYCNNEPAIELLEVVVP